MKGGTDTNPVAELHHLLGVWANVRAEIAAGRLALSPQLTREIHIVRQRIGALRKELHCHV